MDKDIRHRVKRHEEDGASYLLRRLLEGGKGAVPFLPEELAGPQEGLGVLELPALGEARRQVGHGYRERPAFH